MMRPLTTKRKVAIAKVVSRILVMLRRAVGRGERTTVTRRKIRWTLDLTQGIDLAIYLFGGSDLSLRKAYENLLGPGDVVLDLGANIGAHTLPLAKAVAPDGKVVAIEATDYALRRLEANLALNPALQRCVVSTQAVLVPSGAKSGPVEAYASWPLLDGHSVHPLHRGEAMKTDGAEFITVDALLTRLGLTTVNLVKLDVDGNEASVLAGAGELLRQGPPVLMELAPYVYHETGRSLGDVVDLLDAADYRLFHLDGCRRLPLSAADLRHAVPFGAAVNVLAKRE